jgi:peptidoglycan/LPS O-acetylase OafA/YrhL
MDRMNNTYLKVNTMEHFIKIFFFLLMLLVSYSLGRKIAQHRKFDFLQLRNNRYGAIDGLRGYLAISIFVHHFMLTWVWKNTGHWYRPQEIYFQNMGIVGVMIFFMITGYLFTTKILSDKGNTDWIKLYKSRVFRIYPLFIFIVFMITFIIFTQEQYQSDINFSLLSEQYSKWILFHGANIHTHNHTPLIIAGVDWTLKYEWLFYLSLPILAFTLNFNKWFSILLIFIGIYLFSQDYKIFSFNTIHLLFFIIGGITAYLYSTTKNRFSFIQSNIISGLAIILLINSLFFKDIYDPLPILFISLFFIVIALGNTMFGLLEKKSSILLGEISYSIYLIHGLIIYILFSYFNVIDLTSITSIQHTYMFPILIILIITCATLTYLYIEQPSIKLGKKKILSRK